MKINDIIPGSVRRMNERRLLARRINRCTEAIRGDIRQWEATGIVPQREILLSSPAPGSPQVSVSLADLTGIYGIDPLSAMLLMDDIIRANLLQDKSELDRLLLYIENCHTCIHEGNVDALLLERVKNEQPGVWEAYCRLVEQMRNEDCGQPDHLDDRL